MCKDTFEIKRVLLEWIVCAKVHLRSRLTWIDWGARGIFSLKGLDRHQQCQDICGSNYLFRSTHKKRRCCDDFAWELATFVQTLNHHLGDERIGYGVGNGMFDAQDVQDEGEGTPRWRCHNYCGTSRQSRQSILTQNIKICYDCGKLGHITCFCYKAKNNNKDNANNTKDGDDHTFARQHIVHSKAMYKFIMDLGASNHMTSHSTLRYLLHAMSIWVTIASWKQFELVLLLLKWWWKVKSKQFVSRLFFTCPSCKQICFRWASFWDVFIRQSSLPCNMNLHICIIILWFWTHAWLNVFLNNLNITPHQRSDASSWPSLWPHLTSKGWGPESTK